MVDGLPRLIREVASPEESQNSVIKGLNAKTQAVDSQIEKALKKPKISIPRINFKSYFRVSSYIEILVDLI